MDLVIIFGPPAVGKMTVGAELSRLTGLPLFHNHLTIELVLPLFPFGHPAFGRLVTEFRKRIFEEVAASELAGMIFTYVWALDHAADKTFVDELSDLFQKRGGRVCFVELAADLDERLRRNEGESRLAAKPSKRDVERSREHLLDAQDHYQLNSVGDFFYPDQHVRIDNTNLPPQAVASRVVEAFRLPVRVSAPA
jgi:hypothetical protein